MTLIECYTDLPIYNIAACLRLRPEMLVFAGDGEKIRSQRQRYEKFLKQRGLRTRIIPYDTSNKDFDQLRAGLERVLNYDDNCVIDVTGGDEPVIMAVGGVLAGLSSEKRRQVQVQKLDLATQTVHDCLNDNRPVPGKQARLSIEDLFYLHGGSLYSADHQPPRTYFAADLDKLWQIVSDNPKEWNTAIAYLREFESRSNKTAPMCLSLQQLQHEISRFSEKEPLVRQLLEQLHRNGIIHLRSTDSELEYDFTDPMYYYCTRKAGNVLEVKALLEAREFLDNGAPFFHDCLMGVSIDWDGKTNSRGPWAPETRNEIDVMLMHGIAPLFVSCKNGTIEEIELYKLHTVATRFAGPQARRMLIATDSSQNSETAELAITQRAEDMGICFVRKAANMTKQEWRDAFRKALKE